MFSRTLQENAKRNRDKEDLYDILWAVPVKDKPLEDPTAPEATVDGRADVGSFATGLMLAYLVTVRV